MYNDYSFSEIVQNVYYCIMTKIFYPKARMIRRPIYIRGKKSLVGGFGLTTGRFCRFDLPGNKKTLYIGNNCQFGELTHIVALNEVKIGNNVLIASKVFISDTSHGNYKDGDQSSPFEVPSQRKLISGNVEIGDNVWIGENVVVLANVGNGSIVGANSVITKNIPENCIVVGQNKIIKRYNQITCTWEKE